MGKSTLYTRSGDKGQTSLCNGQRVPKTHLRIIAYGTVDELQAALGVIEAFSLAASTRRLLKKIQVTLFYMGAHLSSPKKNAGLQEITEADITYLEQYIDIFDAKLPKLRNFILPGGSKTGALFHLARTICRRAEREIVTLSQKETVDPLIIQYLNRLSDFLFVLARSENHRKRNQEILWKP